MDPYLVDWLNLIIRFLHLITGIAWVGASFYFIWLDNHLQTPPEWKQEKGIKGDLWAIHGGGFYEIAKYKLAPPVIPQTLHWFKWEAYSTWITGFFLLTLIYYVGAETYLIDKRVAELTQWQAIGIGVGIIIAGWFVYDLLCKVIPSHQGPLIGLILLLLATGLSYFLTQVFSARGAYIHMGAVIGTIMAGNVFAVIIPAQKALVDAVKKGEAPDPKWSSNARLRSTHNTYATLPLLFIMISHHYPMTYSHSYNWAVLIAIIIITAAARQYFVQRHTGTGNPVLIIGSLVSTIILAYLIAPKPPSQNKSHSVIDVAKTDVAKIESIILRRCGTCHSSSPTDDIFLMAPAGVLFDDMTDIKQWTARIKARVIDSKDMPFMNKTNMTEEERSLVEQWLAQGAPLSKPVPTKVD